MKVIDNLLLGHEGGLIPERKGKVATEITNLARSIWLFH